MSNLSWIKAAAAWLYAKNYHRQISDFETATDEIRRQYMDEAEELLSYLQSAFSDASP